MPWDFRTFEATLETNCIYKPLNLYVWSRTQEWPTGVLVCHRQLVTVSWKFAYVSSL
jgi:hypothetical protein